MRIELIPTVWKTVALPIREARVKLISAQHNKLKMVEREGFEPSVSQRDGGVTTRWSAVCPTAPLLPTIFARACQRMSGWTLVLFFFCSLCCCSMAGERIKTHAPAFRVNCTFHSGAASIFGTNNFDEVFTVVAIHFMRRTIFVSHQCFFEFL